MHFSLLDDHHSAKQQKKKTGSKGWVLDLLEQYVEFFPPVCRVIKKHADINVFNAGAFKEATYKEMWDMWVDYEDR